MAGIGQIVASRAGRASRVADLRSSLNAINDIERTGRIKADMAQGGTPPSGFYDLSHALNGKETGALARAYADIERGLADELDAGAVSQEYLDYLARMGVDPDTIESVRKGDLPMDPASRAERAREMGLDPDVTWHRYDYPGRTEFTGRRREGLVYANADDSLAHGAAQVLHKHHYPLTAPSSGIHGIDNTPPTLHGDGVTDAQGAMSHKYGFTSKDFGRTNSVINEPLGHNRQESLRILGDRLASAKDDPQIVIDARMGTHRPYPPGKKPPSWEFVETPAFVDDMRSKGTAGTLVRDEADTSVAFSPDARLRHAGLAVFDPRRASSRNILQGLLAPIAVGVGYSASQPSGTEVR